MRVFIFQAGRFLKAGETVIVLKITKFTSIRLLQLQFVVKISLLQFQNPFVTVLTCHKNHHRRRFSNFSHLQVHPGIQGFHCPISRIETGKTENGLLF